MDRFRSAAMTILAIHLRTHQAMGPIGHIGGIGIAIGIRPRS
jgi:hypothetical protein